MSTKETARKEIEKLVKKYELLLQEGRVSQYQEANTRKDFILPLFSALGWEVTSINEVQEETRVSRDRVDYSFNLAGVSKFYLEAKALKTDLDKPEYVQQAIDYAYNKGVPWAVLTDFEKIKVFNAEWKAKTLQDSQFLEIAYNEYLERFDELWLLSKDSLTQGLLDKEAERRLKKDKKQSISKQILADLLKAREKLTKNILKYPRLNKILEEELDESVQRILDRLIFIRTAEDRIIEQNHLLSLVRLSRESRRDLSPALQKIFREFDDGYNSKLFEKHLCEDLVIDDEILAEIIDSLYQTPDGGRYDFSAISADVLGSIYEQYLGHILKKTPKSTRLKETHQHRKEMGIYYTPTYIVDYIVKNTLGEILKKAKPREAMKIRVLDPACGSGSFLIRAFGEFVNYWQKNSPGEFGYFRKIEILKNNLYGVDLDKQAVEITQMNLLLKTLYHRERLPMLEHIKQGNSLISGTEEELKKYFADNWQSKHPFNWNDEFKEIMSAGGFDVVIGNPPYVRQEELKEYKSCFETSFPEVYQGMADLYVYFFERGLKLLKEDGYFGFIVSNKFTRAGYGEKLREFILNNFTIVSYIGKFEEKVFADATVDPCIIIIKKEKPRKSHSVVHDYNKKILQSTLSKEGWNFVIEDLFNLKRKIENKGKKIKDLENVKIYFGIKSGLNEAFIIDEETKKKFDKKSQNIIKPLLRGRDIERYSINYKNFFIILTKIGIDIKEYPMIEKHLESFRNKLVKRTDYKSNLMEWYNLRPCDYYDDFLKSKIIYPDISETGGFYFDDEGYFFNNTIYMICGNIKKYWVGLLNSRLLSWYYKQIASKLGEKGVRYFSQFMENLPIIKLSTDKEQELTELSNKMLELNKQLQKFGDKFTDERRKFESEIQKTDRQIDELVYKLYNLTNEEISIIEES